jgi:preprotein translocase subunit SecD
MQGNGFKLGLTIFFVGLCGFYLFPSVQNLYVSYQMDQMSAEERQEYQRENQQRLENIRESSLNLGLDLQGGMHVTLQMQVGSLLDQLASNKDAAFREALTAASQRARQEDISVVNAFVQEFESRNPDGRLSRYYRSEPDNLTRRSSNDEVQDYLSSRVNDALDTAMQIVRNRVDRYGVTEPSIQKQGSRRISVELPGVEEEERVRNLLESASQLTFHLMGDSQQLQASVQRIIEYYEPTAADSARIADASSADTTAQTAGPDTSEATEGTALATQPQQDAESQEGTSLTEPGAESGTGPQNPLLAVMQPLPRQGSPTVGYVQGPDTAQVNDLILDSDVRDMIPAGTQFLWTANPIPGTDNTFGLLSVRTESELTGDVITQASVTFDQQTNEPKVSMSMDSEGSRIWGRVTKANVGEQVAIVLDGRVYSYPRIEGPIMGGRTEISGLESRQEAQDIVTILQSGSMQAPVDIIEERTVGPSLGEASIRAGLISVIVGLLLVVLFMIMYYRTAGIVADVALLLNVILILGILAGFNATLTLPGIAGIVLTIGMAVDANVLIYDRVREEQNTGKTLKASISAGYEHSLSAILDANITTFFMGVILYSFGVGPIQGFAVTLMAGILSSLFTAIIVTRLIFDYMVEERRMDVSYG